MDIVPAVAKQSWESVTQDSPKALLYRSERLMLVAGFA